MKRYASSLVLIAGLLFAQPALAGKAVVDNEGIAAVVNDHAITMSDVVERMKLLIAASGMPNNPDMRRQLNNQVVNMLIEESIQRQEAEKMGIKVTPDEIADGFATIAKNNNMGPDKFKSTLQHEGISLQTMDDQIAAQIGWGKVVQRKIRPEISVSDTDIDARLQFIRSRIGKTQYEVAEIYLPVESIAKDAETKALAQKLLSEIVSKHASFPQVALQFSQEAAAARGGDLGWVQDGELPDALNQVLVTMKEGDISNPIRSLTGYHILLLRMKRVVTEADIPSREAVMDQIGNERLDAQQHRYLMDLKAGAFIDRRV